MRPDVVQAEQSPLVAPPDEVGQHGLGHFVPGAIEVKLRLEPLPPAVFVPLQHLFLGASAHQQHVEQVCHVARVII